MGCHTDKIISFLKIKFKWSKLEALDIGKGNLNFKKEKMSMYE